MNIKPIEQSNLQALANKVTWGHHWESRTKLLTALIYIFGVITFNSVHLLTITFVITLGAAISMEIPLGYIFKRLLLFLPFFLLMGLPILLNSGFPPLREAYDFVLAIILKSTVSLLVMIMLFGTQKTQELFSGLSNMKLPSVLVTIFFLAYRYTFLLVQDILSLKKSITSRLFDTRLNKRNIKTYGEIAGGLLIKSIDRSENVYRAMASRGFDGKLPPSPPKKICRLDIIKGLLVISYVVLIKFIEGRFLI